MEIGDEVMVINPFAVSSTVAGLEQLLGVAIDSIPPSGCEGESRGAQRRAVPLAIAIQRAWFHAPPQLASLTKTAERSLATPHRRGFVRSARSLLTAAWTAERPESASLPAATRSSLRPFLGLLGHAGSDLSVATLGSMLIPQCRLRR